MRPLLALLAIAAAASAGEPALDPVTSYLPADAFAVVRLAPADRFDAIGRELPALADLLGDRRPLGDLVLDTMRLGIPSDRTKPIYVAVGPDGPVMLLHAAPGATAEGLAALGRGRAKLRLLPDGWIYASDGPAPAGREPVALLPGDASVAVPVGKLIERNREKLDEAIKGIDELGKDARRQGFPVPEGVTKLVKLLATRVLRSLADVTDVTYAVTWRGGRLESEGWIRTREGSALQRWLGARAGGEAKPLVGLLPTPAFWTVDSAGTASALDADVAALLDEALGKGAGSRLLLLLSPSYALHEHLTGHAAGAIAVQGMMEMSMDSIHEVRPGAKIEDAIAAIDAEATNRMLADLGIPLDVTFEPNFAKSGDTAMHRLTYRSSDPQLAMFGMAMQTCFAVEGGRLLVAQSSMAESELRSLLDRVRSGEPKESPHAKAMERLMPDRSEGLSVNVGALKPTLGMLAFAAPPVAKILNVFPDNLWFSTALAVRDGHIHIRGDWPLKECLDFAKATKEALR